MPPPTDDRRWEHEEVFLDGDAFFASLEEGIEKARQTIELEMYIFEFDTLGKKICSLLAEAANRGVGVFVIVDSIGSLNSKYQLRSFFESTPVFFDVYHQLPWERSFLKPSFAVRHQHFFRLFRQANRRNHRKVCVIDGKVAWLGGMNISSVHLRSISGAQAWRDAAIKVAGPDVIELTKSFSRLLRRRKLLSKLKAGRASTSDSKGSSPLVRLNYTRKTRIRNYKALLHLIKTAEKRVWITTPYFVPAADLLRALRTAASRGVDVKILLPRHSDVVFMPWVSAAVFHPLLKAGIEVFEYLPSVLHAKTIIIDDWASLGSSNLNHRSLIHDLEVDVILTWKSSKKLLEQQYLEDLDHSEKITPKNEQKRPWWQRQIGRGMLFFRYWL